MIRDEVEPCLPGALKGEVVGNCYSLGTELILQVKGVLEIGFLSA